MPLYEYHCQGCGHAFETLRGLQERDEDVVCPRCRKKKAEKLLSTCSLLKGGSSTPSDSSCSPKRFT